MKLARTTNFTLASYSLLVAIFSFLLTHNWKILIPTNFQWMSGSGDLSSSFIGWNYFRQDRLFQWPITKNQNYGGEWARTILFTDTPPIFAVPLKFLLLDFQGPIQFTGIQTFISVYITVFFVIKILIRGNLNTFNAVVGSLLIAHSPVILFRSYFFHYSLNLIWIFFASFYLYLRPVYRSNKYYWASLFFIALSWMPYLILYVVLFWIPYLFKVYKITIGDPRNFKSKRVLIKQITKKMMSIEILVPLMASAAALIFIGYWHNNGASSDHGLGFYNSNILSLVNPKSSDISWSRMIPGLPQSTAGQYEGFGFVGVAVLMILLLVIFRARKAFREFLVIPIKRNLPLFLSLTTIFFLSFGFNFTFGNLQILKIPLPEKLGALFSIFRSSGRLIIPVTLFISIFAILYLKKTFNQKSVTLLLSLCLLLNYWEAFPGISRIKSQEATAIRPNDQVLYGNILEKFKPKEIIFVLPENSAYKWKMQFIWEASMRNIPVNDGFFARPNIEKQMQIREKIIADLAKQNIPSRTLYVFYPSDPIKKLALAFDKDEECIPFVTSDKEESLACQK